MHSRHESCAIIWKGRCTIGFMIIIICDSIESSVTINTSSHYIIDSSRPSGIFIAYMYMVNGRSHRWHQLIEAKLLIVNVVFFFRYANWIEHRTVCVWAVSRVSHIWLRNDDVYIMLRNLIARRLSYLQIHFFFVCSIWGGARAPSFSAGKQIVAKANKKCFSKETSISKLQYDVSVTMAIAVGMDEKLCGSAIDTFD